MDIAIAIIQTVGVFIVATYGIFVVIAVVDSIKYSHFYRKYIYFFAIGMAMIFSGVFFK